MRVTLYSGVRAVLLDFPTEASIPHSRNPKAPANRTLSFALVLLPLLHEIRYVTPVKG